MPDADGRGRDAGRGENGEQEGKDGGAGGNITRRELLRRTAILAGGVLLAGCSDLVPPQSTPTTPPAPSPTAAPTSTHAPTSTSPPATAAPTSTPQPPRPTPEPSSTPSPPPTQTQPGSTSTPQPQPTPEGVFPQMDLTANSYNSSRSVTIAGRGVVATSQPLAVQAGLSMLERGGNAVDAAVAAAITLTVVEPTSNGIGSDAFALVWDGRELHGLNGSGRAPRALTLEMVHDRGHKTMPARGWLPVTVPGAPATWRDLHKRFGNLPFATLFEPAIRYAEQGFAVSPIVAYYWGRSVPIYSQNKGPEFAGWMETFAPGGRAPRAGEKWASPTHALTLRLIAESGGDDFYTGQTARAIASFAARTGGLITEADLAAHTSTWVQPISTSYRGYDVWEIPPNGQGIAALIALNILEGLPVAQSKRDTAESFHLQIEAMKLAFADAFRYVADPDFVQVPVAGMLDKGYAGRRRALVGDKALSPKPGDPNSGGTVYLCAADSGGMMVSFIQSNYQGFGSGIVVPGTGVSLQDRGANFSLDPNHPNSLQPGKRPYHTIIPGFLTRDGRAVGPFGVMGGFMQPQGHVQMVVNTIDYALNPQASLDAPRWQWTSGKTVEIESDADRAIIAGLRERGHTVNVQAPGGGFGRGQIIWRMQGGYAAGSDKRADGYAGAL